MILVGMLDSPYVRRVAISMKLMGVPFDHRPLSVFRTFDRFRELNPVVKAPTLVCDDGAVLMDSTLILDYVEGRVVPDKRLMPADGAPRREALRLVGLALAACEKCVQIVYEYKRPEEKRHDEWLVRVQGQANAAFGELERSAAGAKGWLQGGEAIGASDVAVACAWAFGQFYVKNEIPAARYPALAAFSERAEMLPEFISTPLD